MDYSPNIINNVNNKIEFYEEFILYWKYYGVNLDNEYKNQIKISLKREKDFIKRYNKWTQDTEN